MKNTQTKTHHGGYIENTDNRIRHKTTGYENRTLVPIVADWAELLMSTPIPDPENIEYTKQLITFR
jgi:hypothetical protein